MLHIHKAHPWHGIHPGENVPEVVTTFIEIVPLDTVKYEIDKETGYLSIDRPQKYSNIVPALYGFIPQTYCSVNVAELSNIRLNRSDIIGKDPLDICILTEKDVTHGNIIAKAIPIGGLRLLDQDQADDKIIAVLQNDLIYNAFKNIHELPQSVLDRIVHYFTTYKDLPLDNKPRMILLDIYDVDVAHDVIMRSIKDYNIEVKDKVNNLF